MKDKLQTWCLILGIGMWGPVFLGLAITCLFVGEIPGKHGPLVKAHDSPAVFYVAAMAFIIITVKMTQVSLVGAWFLYKQSKRRAENLE